MTKRKKTTVFAPCANLSHFIDSYALLGSGPDVEEEVNDLVNQLADYIDLKFMNKDCKDLSGLVGLCFWECAWIRFENKKLKKGKETCHLVFAVALRNV